MVWPDSQNRLMWQAAWSASAPARAPTRQPAPTSSLPPHSVWRAFSPWPPHPTHTRALSPLLACLLGLTVQQPVYAVMPLLIHRLPGDGFGVASAQTRARARLSSSSRVPTTSFILELVEVSMHPDHDAWEFTAADDAGKFFVTGHRGKRLEDRSYVAPYSNC